MQQATIPGSDYPLIWVHTLIIGSGAAGLNAAVQLKQSGVDDLLILTEGLQMGTSINTGSDKQTYYKLSLCGDEADSPLALAQTLFDGGSVHGDLALVEASLSTRAFMHLVNLGVPFPHDEYGQYVGYKTDHDPRQRATSIGPYTSREMCRALIRRVGELEIPLCEGRVVVRLLTTDEGIGRRCCGALAVDARGHLEAYAAENVVFAVGGPGGLYAASVYPPQHTGAIGLALLAGAKARNLPDAQFGLSSVQFRWNVSGSYMQAIPRVFSVGEEGTAEHEFLRAYYETDAALHSTLFLKGYQWPADASRAVGGSTLIDVLVHRETVHLGRRVYLDFTRNGLGYDADALSDEARSYLMRSGALLATPIERLRAMNPEAIALYAEHGIDLSNEPLEVAVCAQHINGGLAGDLWWESENLAHLFPVGEVNGSHGVHRPGGSALNAGQVAGFRVAQRIAHRYRGWSLEASIAAKAARQAIADVQNWLERCVTATHTWQDERIALQQRMSRYGGPLRSLDELSGAVRAAWEQVEALEAAGCTFDGPQGMAEALRNRQLCYAHAVYLETMQYALASGTGSRGSAIALASPEQALANQSLHPLLGNAWRMTPENLNFRDQVLETIALGPGEVSNAWAPVRPIPAGDLWFERVWARYRSGAVFGD